MSPICLNAGIPCISQLSVHTHVAFQGWNADLADRKFRRDRPAPLLCSLAWLVSALKEMVSDDDVLPESLPLGIYLDLTVHLDELGY